MSSNDHGLSLGHNITYFNLQIIVTISILAKISILSIFF